MAILTTPAIVLRRVEHGESSLICTFYTRNYGRLSAIAKGARRTKSQFAGLLDIMNYLDIVVYTKETRSVQTLSGAEYVRPLLHLQQDMQRTAAGLVIIETIRQAIIGEEPHPEIFDLLTEALEFLNNTPDSGIPVLWWFHLHLASLLGFHPDLIRCNQCGAPLHDGYFSRNTGQIYCRKCITNQTGIMRITNLELRLARYLLQRPLARIDLGAVHKSLGSPSDTGESNEKHIAFRHLTEVLVQYLQYHVEGIGTLRSVKFFYTLE